MHQEKNTIPSLFVGKNFNCVSFFIRDKFVNNCFFLLFLFVYAVLILIFTFILMVIFALTLKVQQCTKELTSLEMCLFKRPTMTISLGSLLHIKDQVGFT